MKTRDNGNIYIDLLDYLLTEYSNNIYYKKKWEVNNIHGFKIDNNITIIYRIHGNKYKGKIVFQFQDNIIFNFMDIIFNVMIYNCNNILVKKIDNTRIHEVSNEIERSLILGIMDNYDFIPYYKFN